MQFIPSEFYIKPKPGECVISAKLQAKNNGVKVGENYYYAPYPLKYMWVNNRKAFLVWYKEGWKETNPIEWDICEKA